jgi:putative chitinase
MAVSDAQAQLKAEGLYAGKIDGDLGPVTMKGLMMAAAGIRTTTKVMEDIAEPIVAIIPMAVLTPPLRLCHFLAQATEETANWSTLVEIGGPTYFARYDGRKDLGNTEPGDGYKYRGRGPLQLTGRVNYTAYAHDLGVDLVNRPDLLLTDMNLTARVAAHYWIEKQANSAADVDDLALVTHLINGGENGEDQRGACLDRLKAIWGLK